MEQFKFSRSLVCGGPLKPVEHLRTDRLEVAFAPSQRLADHVVFVGSDDVPQEPIRVFLIDEGDISIAPSTSRCMQFNYVVDVVDTPLERRGVSHVLTDEN